MTTLEILDGINGLIVKAFPEVTVYLDMCPADFERPSFLLEHIRTDRAVASATAEQVKHQIRIACIDTVDEHYHTSSRRLLEVQQAVAELFEPGKLVIGDRVPRISAVTGGRERDIAFVDVQVEYFDERPRRPQNSELMAALKVEIKLEE